MDQQPAEEQWVTDPRGDNPPDPGLTEQDTGEIAYPDTGDLIDPAAPDPIPTEVTDPDDPSYVEPAAGAVRVDPARFVPVGEIPDRATGLRAQPPPSGTVGTSLPDAPRDDPQHTPGCHA